jgi:hypothetical protein
MKIFWSWQSDTPGKIGRFLVRDALRDAVAQLKEAPDIEEPTSRETREGLHVDQDIQGASGSPDLARTILAKIEISTVVVADVTLVGMATASAKENTPAKKLINSNVAIELGYAFGRLTDANVLMVMNGYYGLHEDLPFDLRHKGGAIVFNLPPDADKNAIERERRSLKERFIAALKPFVQKTSLPTPSFSETPTTFSKGTYFQKEEVLVQIGDFPRQQVTFVYRTESLCYLRIMPVSGLTKPIPIVTLSKVASHVPHLGRSVNVAFAQNDYGIIRYESDLINQEGPTDLTRSAQLFENGEIWNINASLIVAEPNGRPAGLKYPFLPSLPFEQTFFDAVHSIPRFATTELNVPAPWQIEIGLVGVKGVHISMALNGYPEQYGPIRKSEIVRRVVVNDGDSSSGLDRLLLEFFTDVYDSVGLSRPVDLHGFPPSRPSTR